MKKKESKKGIVFCLCCNQIVGDSFPVYHNHNFGNGEMAIKLLLANQLGFRYYEDTKKNRRFLAKHFPPRTELTIKL